MNDQILLNGLNAGIFGVNAVYLYYWGMVAFATKNKHINTEEIELLDLVSAFNKCKTENNFIIMLTTKGGSSQVMKRGITEVINAIRHYPIIKGHVSIEVVTEDLADVTDLTNSFRDEDMPLKYFLLPPNYVTPNKTAYKARALQYMVEQHKENPDPKAYVVHYDEESVFTEKNLVRLIHHLLLNPAGITEGSISYGLDWKRANIICRAMESNRPFACHECSYLMTHPPVSHLHGSNLVIKQSLENEIGWDIGLLDDQALIAEDLVFGLQAYIKYGAGVFGWHRAEMIEQPPFTIKAAIKQRERWVFGSYQAINVIKRMPEWGTMSLKDRTTVTSGIYFKIVTFTLGFPLSIIALGVNIWLLSSLVISSILNIPLHISEWTFLLLPGMIVWLGSVQLGLYYNLRYTDLSRKGKLLEHLKVLMITPISGVFETYGAFKAFVKWNTGKRKVIWVPTPKLATV